MDSIIFWGVIGLAGVIGTVHHRSDLLAPVHARASAERAFVRTGLGGQKVIMERRRHRLLPVFHEIIPINMNTLKLEVSRASRDSLITKDRMRVDVVVAFFVRVKPTVEGVSTAAQTLGQRTLAPESLRALVDDKFVDALRSTAAQMSMPGPAGRARAVRAGGAEHRGRRPDQERAGTGERVADQLQPDLEGVLRPQQRLRRGGPDQAHAGNRAPPQGRATKSSRTPKSRCAREEPRCAGQEAGDRAAGIVHRSSNRNSEVKTRTAEQDARIASYEAGAPPGSRAKPHHRRAPGAGVRDPARAGRAHRAQG
ncbi:SPFH domain-containing protein [Cupriavidus basilensis]